MNEQTVGVRCPGCLWRDGPPCDSPVCGRRHEELHARIMAEIRGREAVRRSVQRELVVEVVDGLER